MPHTARKKSESGYYHVVPKAIADQIIFENDADRRYYLELLDTSSADTGCELLAYCLMSNHVHLVVRDMFDALADFMKYANERYGMYLSDKTGRSGGIFRKPFWSEPILSDEHLLSCVRYVHANPTAAGICNPFEYDWSSAKDYLGRHGLTNTDMILDICGSIDSFIQFSNAMVGCARAFPGSKLIAHLTDDEVLRIAQLNLGKDMLRGMSSLSIQQRNDAIRQLKTAGLTVRQIVRVTGLGHRTVQNA